MPSRLARKTMSTHKSISQETDLKKPKTKLSDRACEHAGKDLPTREPSLEPFVVAE